MFVGWLATQFKLNDNVAMCLLNVHCCEKMSIKLPLYGDNISVLCLQVARLLQGGPMKSMNFALDAYFKYICWHFRNALRITHNAVTVN